MQPRPSFDPELLIIIAISIVALLGLGWIFLTSYRGDSSLPPTLESTAMPINVTPRETEVRSPPPSATPTLEQRPPTATRTSPVSYPGPPGETLPAEGTPTIASLPALSTTPGPEQAQPLSPRKYDDTDPNIAYDRFWTFHRNSGTKFAYKGTLHISNSIGNEVSFLFTGQRFNLGY